MKRSIRRFAAEVADSEEVAPGADAAGYEYYADRRQGSCPSAFEDDALASMTFEDRYTEQANALHIGLMPIITVIDLFVLGLLLFMSFCASTSAPIRAFENQRTTR